MPVSISNRQDVSIGGTVKVSLATWTGAEGDATFTYTVSGGRVLGGLVTTQDADGVMDTAGVRFRPAAGAVAGTVDISIYNRTAVTTGQLFFIYQ